MIEVKLYLYTPSEIALLAEFEKALNDSRSANPVFTGTVVETDVVEKELDQEVAAAPTTPAFEPEAVVAKALSNATAADAVEAFKQYAQANGLPKAREILDKLGLKRAGDIKPEQIPALLEAIK